MYSSTCCVTRHKRIGYNVGGEIHSRGGPRLEYTSEMVHHRGASLSEQQTAHLLVCHGTQQGFVTVDCYMSVISQT